jgi:hypothetical protein
MVPPIPTSAPPQPPVADLLGDDDGFTPYVEAPNTQTSFEDDFGQFQEASVIPTKQVTSPTAA